MKSLKSKEPGEIGNCHSIRWIRNVEDIEDLIWMFPEIMEVKWKVEKKGDNGRQIFLKKMTFNTF